MEVRDPVHGSIHILDEEIPIIKDKFFQRLRNIKQLGVSEYSFPGATHTRYIHSIGVMHVCSMAFDKIFKHIDSAAEIPRLKETVKLACLLHDIGHAPLSHSTEVVMPMLSSLNIPPEYLSEEDREVDRQATHEDYTIKSIADSSFKESFYLVERKFGIRRQFIADLIRGETNNPGYFTIGDINYFPILSQLVSSELDCDRMDYLLRDSYFCGVSYGNFDLDWLLDNLTACVDDGKAYLGISERAIVTFDDFLLSRYHMFIMVYFHYRSVCLEQLLYRYFKNNPTEYTIPADIEDYVEHDDHYLLKVLRNSKCKYAQSIVNNNIPRKIYESFNEDQLKKLDEIQTYLEKNNIEFIRCSSASRLSKYYGQVAAPVDRKKGMSMKVSRQLHDFDQTSFSDIDEATDLFLKFSKSHAINRLHCEVENLDEKHRKEVKKIINS